MLAKSHMLFALVGASALSYTGAIDAVERFCGVEGEMFYLGALVPLIIIGSVLPDIDEPRSFIGRKFPIISRLVSLSFSHRGFTHFLLFPLIICALGVFLAFYSRVFALCAFALAFGVFMHQMGDMLTKSGIPFYFFPFSRVRAVLLPSALRFKTGSAREKSITYAVFVPLLALCGMDKFDIFGSFELEQILKIIGEIA